MQTVEEKDWIKDNYVPVAIINRTMADLSAQFQFAADQYDQDGLGLAHGKLMKTAGGRPFAIEQLLQAPTPWDCQTTIHCKQDQGTMERDLGEILREMSVRPNELTWVCDDIDEARLLRSLTPPAPKGPGAPAP